MSPALEGTCTVSQNVPSGLTVSMYKSGLFTYRQILNIRCTKSQNLNVSRLTLQLSLPNPLKPGVKSKMKM